MKTKFYWLALLASAALIAPAQAGDHHGGGGGGGFAGGGFAPAGAASARGGGAGSFHSAPFRSFGGGRMIYPGQRFSSFGPYSSPSSAFRQPYINSNRGASIGSRQFAPGNFNRASRAGRLSN